MQANKSRRSIEFGAIGLVMACVAGLYAAALPDMLSTGTPGEGGRTASSGVPAAQVARALGMHDTRRKAPAPQGVQVKQRLDVHRVSRIYQELDYALDNVRTGTPEVPRVFLSSVPSGLKSVPDVETRKSVFLRTMLPLILKVNEDLAGKRARLEAIAARQGRALDPADARWLADTAAAYKVDPAQPTGKLVKKLLMRVDIVPPSLALAQAAEESGWGTSRFARQGNALFGQWTTGRENGLVPQDRPEGATHVVKSFDRLVDAVAAYAHNLNTHAAYAEFRAQRAQQRRLGRTPNGYSLARTLTAYSERGQDYVDSLQLIMRANELAALDQAKLSARPVEVASLASKVDSKN